VSGPRQSSRHPARRRRGRRNSRDGHSQPSIIAALDLGTNNCRLLVARPQPDGFTVIDGYSRVVRLGEGMAFSGSMSVAAMDRAISALSVCAERIRRRDVTSGRYIATEACRQAANGPEFIARVEEETGLTLEAIPSREEAELTLAGCLPLLDPTVPYALTFDVGGGSAEVLWIRLRPDALPEVLGWISLPCGVVTVTERYGTPEIAPEDYCRLVEDIQRLLRPFDETHGISGILASGHAQMLGTAGTVTTIAAVNMGLERYNRSLVDGCWLDFEAVHEVTRKLVNSSFDERASYGCIGQNRAELVVAGCGVLEAVCKTWRTTRLRVADRGVREGILLSLARQALAGRSPSPLAPSLQL
jgi:exopolyphosphatase / guanosine-5'-triphosphate,3'-diphosphate pyrophosphatase